ncbi:MAG: diacylglycerol kinase [Oligosphaeraceae bacterium]
MEEERKQSTETPLREIPRKLRGASHFFAAARYSAKGLKAAFLHEAAFRQDLLLVAVHTILLFLLPLSWEARIPLLALGGLLLAVELLNSALEAIVDLVSPQWHELAGRAKDMGSAAVFCLLATLGGCWLVVIYNLLNTK